MADVTDPDNPLITTAASATVVSDNTQELLMRLRDGVRDETVADQPEQSNISTFTTTDLPLMLEPAERSAPGPPGHRALRDADERAARAHPSGA